MDLLSIVCKINEKLKPLEVGQVWAREDISYTIRNFDNFWVEFTDGKIAPKSYLLVKKPFWNRVK